MSYDEFLRIMSRVENIIGSGSDYSKEKLESVTVAKTYEQAVDRYNSIIEDDKITNAYARLFSDYIGIMLGILPAFFGVTRVMKDKRSKVNDTLYSKEAQTFYVVIARYLAMITMEYIPVLIISCIACAENIIVGAKLNVTVDYLAYIKYSLGWLLPIMIFVTAVAYFVSELTESMFAIFVNGIIWFVDILSGASTNLRVVGSHLVPRFNVLGDYEIFTDLLTKLTTNRLIYAGAGLILVACTFVLYDIKRKGGHIVCGKISENNSSE